MYFPTLFLCWRDPRPELSPADLARVRQRLSPVGGLRRALGFTPMEIAADQPYAADGRGPALTLELRFADVEALAKADLGDLLAGGLASLGGAAGEAQAMWGRDFATPDPALRLAAGEQACTFLVEYPEPCADPAAWLDHYDSHHPKLMVRFPGVREVATFRPAPEAAPPWASGRSMQRNKVVFDSGEALAAALASPILAEMRVDSAGFPPTPRRPTHFPMATHAWI